MYPILSYLIGHEGGEGPAHLVRVHVVIVLGGQQDEHEAHR